MRKLLLSLGLAALLAGCAGSGPPGTPVPSSSTPAPPAPVPATPEPPAGVDAPAWAPGDWWRWRVEGGGAAPVEVTTMVLASGGGVHHVGVDRLDEGLQGLALHVLLAGRVDAASLAWEVHDAPAVVLAFPLRDGATWEGAEEGRALRFEARATRARAPGGEVDAFDVVGRTGDSVAVSLTYAPSVGHMLRYAVHYGGEEPFATATLVAHGRSASRGFLVEMDDAFTAFASAPRPEEPAPPGEPPAFEVAADATHVLLACWAGGSGAQRATLLPPAGEPVACERASAEEGPAYAQVLAPAAPGPWRAVLAAAGGWLEAEAYVVRAREAQVQ